MSFARERIKKAHKGRETRGVLIESTEHAIGSSNWSILVHFVGSFTLFSLPVLLNSIQVYQSRSHAFNVVKYQTFHTPWKYRRDHVSHMRLDRFRRACKTDSTPRESPQKDTPPDPVTVFVNTAKTGTIAITVTPTTTVRDLREAICHRGYTTCCNQGPMYLLGLWRPLRFCKTMAELGVNGTRCEVA
ncbi:hypothetical protein C8J57DRAFT_1237926 [Mycena rebaudengoi]|nr:hypothetical protein C8J57DRAFT_1237926 [Mycena rebaudengoi]